MLTQFKKRCYFETGGDKMSEMTAKKLIGLLKKNGYHEVSIKGDHHKYKRETDGKTFVVPYTSLKSTIAPGTYKAICRQAGIDG